MQRRKKGRENGESWIKMESTGMGRQWQRLYKMQSWKNKKRDTKIEVRIQDVIERTCARNMTGIQAMSRMT
jgi:hypothetical protein